MRDMIQFQQRFLTQKPKGLMGRKRGCGIRKPSTVPNLAYKGPWKHKDRIILGADTRTIEGPLITEKNCEKIHHMAPNIYCCGVGTTTDTEAITVHNWTL
ncbi:proteasome subunit beta type-7-A-like isoform X1 [Carya illinoinensis]|nr:proteasome subunit beta type-7-A-like isoform X1 [Carya illinoinensis]XP_042965081.1 proteasome subunit beta type-7-A-like isoform X1 [Carya illinoinensis]